MSRKQIQILSALFFAGTFCFFAWIALFDKCIPRERGIYTLVFILGVTGASAFLASLVSEKPGTGAIGAVTLLFLLLGGEAYAFEHIKELASCERADDPGPTQEVEFWHACKVGKVGPEDPKRPFGGEKATEVWPAPKYPGIIEHIEERSAQDVIAIRDTENRIRVFILGNAGRGTEGTHQLASFTATNGRGNGIIANGTFFDVMLNTEVCPTAP